MARPAAVISAAALALVLAFAAQAVGERLGLVEDLALDVNSVLGMKIEHPSGADFGTIEDIVVEPVSR